MANMSLRDNYSTHYTFFIYYTIKELNEVTLGLTQLYWFLLTVDQYGEIGEKLMFHLLSWLICPPPRPLGEAQGPDTLGTEE